MAFVDLALCPNECRWRDKRETENYSSVGQISLTFMYACGIWGTSYTHVGKKPLISYLASSLSNPCGLNYGTVDHRM